MLLSHQLGDESPDGSQAELKSLRAADVELQMHALACALSSYIVRIHP